MSETINKNTFPIKNSIAPACRGGHFSGSGGDWSDGGFGDGDGDWNGEAGPDDGPWRGGSGDRPGPNDGPFRPGSGRGSGDWAGAGSGRPQVRFCKNFDDGNGDDGMPWGSGDWAGPGKSGTSVCVHAERTSAYTYIAE